MRTAVHTKNNPAVSVIWPAFKIKLTFSFTSGFRSASVSLGLDVPDPGETVDGTKCGDNKVA